MPIPTQENRQLVVDTPLGKDVLLLTGFYGHEEISRLFQFRLQMLSEKDPIEPQDIVGKNVTCTVKLSDGKPRPFNGLVSRFFAGSAETGFRRYTAEVVPWLWFLTRTADCRIFQNKSIPEIIEQIFKDLGFKDYEMGEVKGSHPKWEYCVQYRETDFNFVSRLMEHAGIFYFFRHETGKHTLVMADQKGAYKFCPEKDVEHEHSFGSRFITDRITSWDHQFEFRPGKWAQTDYNFETPHTNLASTANSVVKQPGTEGYEIYDYPGEYKTKAEGDAQTTVRMEEDETPYQVTHASSTCKTFTCGGKFTLSRHDIKDEVGKTYVITSITHSAMEPATYGEESDHTMDYRNSFMCIPETVSFRPARTTPKPMIHGVQTAVVVGPAKEEIWPDEYGRVKVQFFWDREGVRNEKTTCWIRCMQTSAGRLWGSMFIPRVGQEVIVAFHEGNPDRPVITGLLYNAEQMPAYELPGEKTKSYIKTNSSLGGEGFNEWRFEDKKDKEQIFIHAQKNMDIRVLNDSLERIFGNRHQIIGWEKDGKKGGDQREMIYQDKHLDVKRDHVEHIEGNVQLLIGKGDAQAGGNLDIVVEKDKKELLGANQIVVKKNRNETIDGSQSLTVGENQHEKLDKKHAHEATGEIHWISGNKVVLEATAAIMLQVGGNSVVVAPGGVWIQGTETTINEGGSAGSGSGSSPAGPTDPKEAKPTVPDIADNSKSGQKSAPDTLS
jgi:type VI secretion system secreted protein VgrG